MKLSPKTTATLAAVPTALLMLFTAGCSSSNSSDTLSIPPTDQYTPPPSPSAEDYNAEMLPPTILTPSDGVTEYTAKVGEEVVISLNDPTTAMVDSSAPSVVRVVPATMQGEAIMNPSFKALTEGTSILDIVDSGQRYAITVTVQP